MSQCMHMTSFFLLIIESQMRECAFRNARAVFDREDKLCTFVFLMLSGVKTVHVRKHTIYRLFYVHTVEHDDIFLFILQTRHRIRDNCTCHSSTYIINNASAL